MTMTMTARLKILYYKKRKCNSIAIFKLEGIFLKRVK